MSRTAIVGSLTRISRGADAILRAATPGRGFPSLRVMLAGFVLGGLLYGAVMGCFGGVTGERVWQPVVSAIKVPLLLGLTFVLTLPSFFVFNTLLGVRQDFGEAVRGLMAAQACLSIVLASLAPLTAFWYASSADYQSAVLFNGVIFAVASLAAQHQVRRHYRPLIARNPRHRILLRCWLALFIFTGIQMGWLLRPFVGAPGSPTRFFREGAWDNAWVIVSRLVWRAVSGIVG